MRYFIFLLLIIIPFSVAGKKRKHSKKKHKTRDRRCLIALSRTGVRFKKGPYLKGMNSPVTILGGRVGKLLLRNGKRVARPVMDCRTALALYRVRSIFFANGSVKALLVGKFYSYRYVKNTAHLSRHASGLAMDIYGIKMADGKIYTVTSDYIKGLGRGKSCEGNSKKRGARLLRQIACDLDRSGYFKSILTPDADRDHRDHFHISVYRRGERRKRKNRTVLIESQNFGRRWVKRLPKYGYPSIRKVRSIVKSRRRANRRLIRRWHRKKRHKSRSKKKKSRSHH